MHMYCICLYDIVKKALRHVFAIHGLPEQIVGDNGTYVVYC